jgi:hypothetical protein
MSQAPTSPLRRRHQPPLGFPPQTPREPRSTGVDASLPLDEPIQRLRIRLARRRVPHHPAPLAPRPFVGLRSVGRASNDGGERIFPAGHIQAAQPNGALSSRDALPFGRHQVTKPYTAF